MRDHRSLLACGWDLTNRKIRVDHLIHKPRMGFTVAVFPRVNSKVLDELCYYYDYQVSSKKDDDDDGYRILNAKTSVRLPSLVLIE